MSWTTYVNGVLAETGVDNATPPTGGTVTDYNLDGSVAGTRAYTPAELASAQAAAQVSAGAANYQSILNAIATQRANNTTYLGITSPTNTQVAAQVAALTRQNNALMRLAANDLTGTN